MLNAKFEFMEEMVRALFLLCVIYLFYLTNLPKSGEMQKNIFVPYKACHPYPAHDSTIMPLVFKPH